MQNTYKKHTSDEKFINEITTLLLNGKAELALTKVLTWTRGRKAIPIQVIEVQITAEQHIGKYESALKRIENLQKQREVSPHIKSVKAVCLRGLGQNEEAIRTLKESLAKSADHGESWHNLSIIYSDMGRWQEALEPAQKATDLLPTNINCWRNYGRVLINLREGNLALGVYNKIKSKFPPDPEMFQGFSASYMLQNRWQEAEEYVVKALQLSPELGSAYGNYAVIKKNLGDWVGSKDLLQRAMELEPENIEHRWNYALCVLGLGQFKEGWSYYENRYDPRRTVKDRVVLPPIKIPMVRQGDDVTGRTIAIVAEQGLGDSIQFCRFARDMKARGATVVLMVPVELTNLLKTLPWADHVCSKWSEAPPLDGWTFIMSLPHVINDDRNRYDDYGQYLFPTIEKNNEWLAQIGGSNTKLKVGIVWAGRPVHTNDANRSMALRYLDDLEGIDGVQYYSLQMGDHTQEISTSKINIVPLGDKIKDFADTAAILNNLDLLISVDSSPVHLGGALNIPVWVLIPFTADFRWLNAGNENPWYKSVQLFRQHAQGDWAGVMLHIKNELKKLIGEERRGAYVPVIRTTENGKLTSGVQLVLEEAVQQHVQGHRNVDLKYKFVLQHFPKNKDALRNLAAYYRQTGAIEESKKAYQRAFPECNKDEIFLANYSNFLLDINELEQCESIAKTCLELNPNNRTAKYVVGCIKLRGTDLEGAKLIMENLLNEVPNNVEFLTAYGLVKIKQSNYDDAIKYFNDAININKYHVEAYLGKARAFMYQDRLEEALEAQDIAIGLKPDIAECYMNKSVILSWKGDYQGAIKNVRKVLELNPNLPDAHFHLGLYLLATKELTEGFKEYEWRYHPQRMKDQGIELPKLSKPAWKGQDLDKKTILIFPEQGHGDFIQFIRFIYLLKQKGASVWLAAKPELYELTKSFPYVDKVITEGDKVTGYDYWAFPMSLPLYLNTDYNSIPKFQKYLYASENKIHYWENLLNKEKLNKKIIGLVWRGSKGHAGDKWRSLQVEQFIPLMALDKYEFVGIDVAGDSNEFIFIGDYAVRNIGYYVKDFSDTAAILKNIDLLITVDSAPAHLAGALGVPVWTIIGVTHDWRWFNGDNNTPWYDSMRLYRQRKRNVWNDCIAAIYEELKLGQLEYKS